MEFRQIYEMIAPKLTNYLVGSGSSYHDACEIVQETFVRVWKHRDELMDDEEQVRGYVFTVARNCRKNLVRDRARETLEPEIADAGSYETDITTSDALGDQFKAAFSLSAPTMPEAALR